MIRSRTPRSLVWFPIALALIAWVGCARQQGGSSSETPVSQSQETVGETHTVALKVPSMHCPYGCYPSVKETLTGLPGVQSVELVPQAEEGKINDPRVTVVYAGEFDSQGAVAALAKADFPGAEVEKP